MEKIFNYILKGKGIGLKYIFYIATIISLIFAIYIRIAGADLVPYANDIINQMLPLKVENGVVVNPQNTIKVAQLREGDVSIPLPLVLNTNIEDINPAEVPEGIYITKTKIYAINDQEIRIYPFSEDFEALPQDYSEGIKSGLTWVAVFSFVAGAILISVLYFIAVLLYSVAALLLGVMFGKKYEFDARMRLSAVCFLTVYVALFCLNLTGAAITVGGWTSFIVIILLQSAIIYKLPAANNEEVALEVKSEDKQEVNIKEVKQEEAKPQKEAVAVKTEAKAQASKAVKKETKKAADKPKKEVAKKEAPKKEAAKAPKKAEAKNNKSKAKPKKTTKE